MCKGTYREWDMPTINYSDKLKRHPNVEPVHTITPDCLNKRQKWI